MDIFIIYKDVFAERVAGHLINDVNFCTSCGTGCNHCRLPYGTHANCIQGFHEIEGDIPEFIDEPGKYLPQHVPRCDIIIPIGMHSDILSAIPTFTKDHGIPAAIIPVEDKRWLQLGLQQQLAGEFRDLGVQCAFPRPFCELDVKKNDESKSIIRRFMDEYKIGKPIIELDIKNEKIDNGRVIRSEPCGCAYYLIQQLRGERVFDETISLDEKISLAHHSFPCSASMDKDPVLGDSPLHLAGYIARDCIHDAIEQELGFVDKTKFHKSAEAASSP
jgi:thymidylate synthase